MLVELPYCEICLPMEQILGKDPERQIMYSKKQVLVAVGPGLAKARNLPVGASVVLATSAARRPPPLLRKVPRT